MEIVFGFGLKFIRREEVHFVSRKRFVVWESGTVESVRIYKDSLIECGLASTAQFYSLDVLKTNIKHTEWH